MLITYLLVSKWSGALPEEIIQFSLKAACISTLRFWRIPLIDFVHQVLAFYNVALTQLISGVWWTILSYEAFCVDISASSYNLEDFATIYTMQKISLGVHFLFHGEAGWSWLLISQIVTTGET